MSIESLENRLRHMPIEPARLLRQEPMAQHTTFRIGGRRIYFFPPPASRRLPQPAFGRERRKSP